MNSIILEEAKELAGWDGQAEVLSIYGAMQQLKDARRKQGKRYPLALILTYLLLAKATGETTLQAITEWIRLRGAWLQQVLPQAGPHFPCAATYSNVLRAVELSRIEEFLTPQWIQGRLVSADALHTQQPFCLSVRLSGGDYLLLAKGNQPTLREDLHLFFCEPPADCRGWRKASTCDSGHGRVEMRELVASTELNEFLAKPWSGVAQVFRLRRRVCKPLVCTQEIVYGFTSLTAAQASPQRLLELIRDHWAIENRLHRRRDVTLQEDACQVRKGMAPRILAILTSFLLALFDWLGVSNVASHMRTFAARPILALRLFLLSLEKIK